MTAFASHCALQIERRSNRYKRNNRNELAAIARSKSFGLGRLKLNLSAGFSASSLDPPADEPDDEAYQLTQSMRAILSILMIASLVLQAMFGCCRLGSLHCAHGADEAVSAVDCTSDHHAKVAPNLPGEPCHCKVQCLGLCNYLPTAKVRIEPLSTSLPVALAAIISATGASHFREAYSQGRWEHSGGESLAPLRLHLLNQVWLT